MSENPLIMWFFSLTIYFSTISRFETQSIASIKGEDMDMMVEGVTSKVSYQFFANLSFKRQIIPIINSNNMLSPTVEHFVPLPAGDKS